jgi:hypothetical protein
MIGMVYAQFNGGKLTNAQDLGLKVAAPVGTFVSRLTLTLIFNHLDSREFNLGV